MTHLCFIEQLIWWGLGIKKVITRPCIWNVKLKEYSSTGPPCWSYEKWVLHKYNSSRGALKNCGALQFDSTRIKRVLIYGISAVLLMYHSPQEQPWQEAGESQELSLCLLSPVSQSGHNTQPHVGSHFIRPSLSSIVYHKTLLSNVVMTKSEYKSRFRKVLELKGLA